MGGWSPYGCYVQAHAIVLCDNCKEAHVMYNDLTFYMYTLAVSNDRKLVCMICRVSNICAGDHHESGNLCSQGLVHANPRYVKYNDRLAVRHLRY